MPADYPQMVEDFNEWWERMENRPGGGLWGSSQDVAFAAYSSAWARQQWRHLGEKEAVG